MNTAPFLAALVATTIVVVLHPRHRQRTLVVSASSAASVVRSARPTLLRRQHEAALDHALPELLDLLVVTLQAGIRAPAAFAAIAPHAPSAVLPAIASVAQRCERGERFINALDSLVEHLGTRALGLVAAISAAERSGLPLAPTVDRIADDARAHRRRSAEIEARRLPVRLAVPLVCCTLPSFICIAIGPVLVGALSSLRSV